MCQVLSVDPHLPHGPVPRDIIPISEKGLGVKSTASPLQAGLPDSSPGSSVKA